MTMFNILLIIAGILEYILLGVNFKVCIDSHLELRLGGLGSLPLGRAISLTPTWAAS